MPRPTTNWHESHSQALTRGERAADRLRNGMGSWWFVVGFLIFMVIWGIANVLELAWDPYPYILLNLLLSTMAGLQGAILLIAARRQDAVAAALAQHDYETNAAAKAEIEQLMELSREQLAVLRELNERLERRERFADA